MCPCKTYPRSLLLGGLSNHIAFEESKIRSKRKEACDVTPFSISEGEPGAAPSHPIKSVRRPKIRAFPSERSAQTAPRAIFPACPTCFSIMPSVLGFLQIVRTLSAGLGE